MSDLLKKFAVSMPPPIWRDVHVGVALSGGPDSVALLRAAAEFKHRSGGKGELFALHVNHKLRGAESDGDARWCEALCRELGVHFERADGNVATRAAIDGDGIEAAARQERYRLLTAMAEARGVRYLFFGHTRDDQVETVLFRILRGTGIRGLTGIAASRPLTPSLTLCRPILDCTRQEVIAYLNECGQDYRFDSSNASCEFARNRIRTELLPLLRENYYADVDEALVRLAEQAAGVQTYVETQAREVLQEARIETTAEGFVVNVTPLSRHSPLLISEALRVAWRDANLPEQAMTRERWTELANLTREDASRGVLNLPGNVRAELARGFLVVERSS